MMNRRRCNSIRQVFPNGARQFPKTQQITRPVWTCMTIPIVHSPFFLVAPSSSTTWRNLHFKLFIFSSARLVSSRLSERSAAMGEKKKEKKRNVGWVTQNVIKQRNPNRNATRFQQRCLLHKNCTGRRTWNKREEGPEVTIRKLGASTCDDCFDFCLFFATRSPFVYYLSSCMTCWVARPQQQPRQRG